MSDIKIKTGTPLTVKASGGTKAITLTNLANGAARQSAKIDLGNPRARDWTLKAEIVMNAAPTAGNVIEFYWSASPHATDGTQNDGGASGTDAAYKAGEEDEWVRQLQQIGVMPLTNDGTGTIQSYTMWFQPKEQYGSVIVLNKSGQNLENSASNHLLTLTPYHVDVT